VCVPSTGIQVIKRRNLYPKAPKSGLSAGGFPPAGDMAKEKVAAAGFGAAWETVLLPPPPPKEKAGSGGAEAAAVLTAALLVPKAKGATGTAADDTGVGAAGAGEDPLLPNPLTGVVPTPKAGLLLWPKIKPEGGAESAGLPAALLPKVKPPLEEGEVAVLPKLKPATKE
jgi:hypothetical protein